MSPELKEAIKLIKSGQKQEGKEILLQILNEDENNDVAWVWLTATVDTDEMRLECLEKALKINPNNETAKRGFAKISRRLQKKQEQSLENIWDEEPESVMADPEPQQSSTSNEWSYEEYTKREQDQFANEAKPQTAVSRTNHNPLTTSPWLTIFYAPRLTINAILQSKNPEENILLIAAALGIFSGLGFVLGMGLVNPTYFIIGFIVLLLVGPVFSIIGLYLGGAIYGYIGFFLGGQGSARDVRVALAWSYVPRMALTILSVLQIVLFITAVPLTSLTSPTQTPDIPASVNLLSCIQFPLSLWYIYIYLQCLGAAHRFSAWRALATIMMPSILLGFIFCGLTFLIAITS